jgi:hypothetical protein
MAIVPVHRNGPVTLIGLASDTKPTIAPDGSIFIESDTGVQYRFASLAWARILGVV